MIFYLTGKHTTRNVRIVMKHTNANGRGDSAAEYHDGQVIRLPQGWSLRLSMNWDADAPYLQGFVYSPTGDNQDSASLCAARDLGTTTGGEEIEIPHAVMVALQDERFDDLA